MLIIGAIRMIQNNLSKILGKRQLEITKVNQDTGISRTTIERCGAEFKARTRGMRYCSYECRYAYKHKERNNED